MGAADFRGQKSQKNIDPCCDAPYNPSCAVSLTPLPFLGVSSLLTRPRFMRGFFLAEAHAAYPPARQQSLAK
jgi:hypothetical protein